MGQFLFCAFFVSSLRRWQKTYICVWHNRCGWRNCNFTVEWSPHECQRENYIAICVERVNRNVLVHFNFFINPIQEKITKIILAGLISIFINIVPSRSLH